MTPARLEEVRVHVEHQRRYYGVRQPRPVSAAVELLDEVKRLRGTLEEICRWDDCERGCASLAEQALAGEEPTP